MAPPKAGFHATQPAAVVELEADGVAGQPGVEGGGHPSGHLATPGGARGHDDGGLDLTAPVGDRRGDVLLDDRAPVVRRRGGQQHHLVGTPAAQHPSQLGSPGFGGEQRLAHGRHPSVELGGQRCGRAQQLTQHPLASGLDQHGHHRAVEGRLGAGATAGGTRRSIRSARERPGRAGRGRAARRPRWPPASATGPARRTWRRTTDSALISPTRVGLAGLAPRSGPQVGRAQPFDARPVHRGQDLGVLDLARVDESLGHLTARPAGSRWPPARRRPARSRPGRSPDASSTSCFTPVAKGRSSSWASSGPTWPVSASTELRPHSTRSNSPMRSRAAARARAVARVSLPAKAGSLIEHGSVGAVGQRLAQHVLGRRRARG